MNEFTSRIAKEIEKDFGKDVLISGEEAAAVNRKVYSWSPALDIVTSGGVEEGSWVGVSGPEKVGKTTSALSLSVSAQQGGCPVYYDKVEGRLSTHHLQGIEGLSLKAGDFNIIQSTPEKILSANDHLRILCNILRSVPRAFVIIDSISALVEEKELDEGVGTETRGGGAKLFSQFCRLMNNVVPVQKSIVVGITHLIYNTSGMGPKYLERGAKMWQYQCDYQLRVTHKTPWKDAKEKQIGIVTHWCCNTSPLGPPGMTCDGFLRFGVGLDRVYECINLAASIGLIKKAGSWLTMEFLGDDKYKGLLDGKPVPKAQGLEKIYQMLRSEPKWARALQYEVMANVGICPGADA